MAENPRFDIGALLAQDEELAQLLADVLEGQRRQEAREAEWRNDLQAMQERRQNMNQQWAAACARGFRAAQPLIQDRMDRLDNVHPRRENDFVNDFVNNIELVYGPIERICDLIINELAREEEFDDENLVGGNEPRGAIEVAPNRHHSDPPADRQREPGPIRPTGRAVRRRIPYTISRQPRLNNFFEVSLDFDEPDFRIVYRVSKRVFWEIVDLIRANEVFINRGRRKQRPVYHQLAAFLIRYGSMGSRGNFTALLTSVAKGSIPIYCERVAYAIRVFGLTCIGWPTAERKAEIKAAFREVCGLDGIVGVVDGSLIDLAKRPSGSEESFRSRKGTIATNIQAVVDHEGRFIAYETGFPGSRNDISIWKQSFVWSHRQRHFNDGEFVLADGGYQPSPFVLTPFSRNERQGADRGRKIDFNQRISRARVLVERTFGQLKSRFPSLVMMGDIGNQATLYSAIDAMIVLHNVCYDLHDTVNGEPDAFVEAGGDGYDAVDQEVDDMDWGPGADINERLLDAGRAFRLQCMDIICPEQ